MPLDSGCLHSGEHDNPSDEPIIGPFSRVLLYGVSGYGGGLNSDIPGWEEAIGDSRFEYPYPVELVTMGD